jgi:outer membrane lipoprotein-sorting protein
MTEVARIAPGKALVHMEIIPCRNVTVGTSILVCILLAAVRELPTHAQQETPAIVSLTVEQIVKNLEQRTHERTQALHHFEGIRVYRLQYRGVLGDRDADMVVKISYQLPTTKNFTVISQSGSKFVSDRIFKKLLESEQEALRPENQKPTILNTENYTFGLVGTEQTPEGVRYVLSVLPRSKNKFLYRGKVWVDAKDFAIVRIEAEPAKTPSFWIKKSVIEQTYAKVNNFWLPAWSRSETEVRLSGRAVLSIEYKDYEIIKADPLPAEGEAQVLIDLEVSK